MTVQVNLYLRELCAIADCTCQSSYWFKRSSYHTICFPKSLHAQLPSWIYKRMTTTQLPGRALRKSTVPGIKYVVLGCVLSASSCRVLLMVELAMQCIDGA